MNLRNANSKTLTICSVIAVLAMGLLALVCFVANANADETKTVVPDIDLSDDRPTPRVQLDPGDRPLRRVRPNLDPDEAISVDRPRSSYAKPLSTFPELAIARTREHRVIELSFNSIKHVSPTKRSERAIKVATKSGGLKELKLRTNKHFFLADECYATLVDGTELSADSLLKHLKSEPAVVVTHIPNTVPEHHLAALSSSTILLQVPHTPRVQLRPSDFGEVDPGEDGIYLSRGGEPYPRLEMYPELCSATANHLGIVEVCCCNHTYSTPTERDAQAVAVTTANGTTEVKLYESQHRFLATELNAYRPDGTPLSRSELLYALKEKRSVLATIAPAKPPQMYLSALAEDSIVLEIPFEPLVKISAGIGPMAASKSDTDGSTRYAQK